MKMADHHDWRLGRITTAAALAVAMQLAIVPGAAAKEIPFGDDSEVSGTFDVTVSYGAQWRTEDSQDEDLVPFNRGLNYASEARVPDKGDLVTNAIVLLGELSLDYRNFGFVGSFSYQYDHEIMNGDSINPVLGGRAPWTKAAEDYSGSAFDVLDAYVFGAFNLGESGAPLEVRLGKQVINWGEGLFFLDGVAQQVPLNINKLTTPGSDLKEAYIPVEALYANLGIGDYSSIEAYVQFRWRRAEMPPVGTFFGSDAFFRGGTEPVPGSGEALAGPGAPDLPMRDPDIRAKNSGQWGVAFRTLVGDTEYGLYYSRYHEVFPFIRWTGGYSIFGASQIWPEDLDMFGASLATTLGAWSVNAEIAYRPDRPMFTLLGVTDAAGIGQEKHDSWHASVHGIWLGGPLDFIGIDNQLALVQFGLDYIDGDTDNLAPMAAITRDSIDSVGTTATADSTAYGVAAEWVATWNNVFAGNDLSLDIFVQRDLKGDSHFWGNFAEKRWLGATSLTLAVGNAAEIGLTHSWMSSKRSDYEDQDLLIFFANYKF